MKYINKFSTNADYQAFTWGEGYVTPNICYVTESKGLKFKPKEKPVSLITFTIGGVEYQAKEGMTFYDWAMSEYYDDSCPLSLSTSIFYNLRDGILRENVNSGDAIYIMFGEGFPVMPSINTDTVIQPISYTADNSTFGPQ